MIHKHIITPNKMTIASLPIQSQTETMPILPIDPTELLQSELPGQAPLCE